MGVGVSVGGGGRIPVFPLEQVSYNSEASLGEGRVLESFWSIRRSGLEGGRGREGIVHFPTVSFGLHEYFQM